MNHPDNGEHVFVVGSSRSGTTLVNTILLSSPLYANYRAETQLLNGCDIKYGQLTKSSSKKYFLSEWLRSRQFKRSGLSQEEFEALLFDDGTTSYFQLQSKFMAAVAAKQSRDRWVDSTPANAFNLEKIATSFPKAKVVHVIRDGRAVALSLAKLGWSGIKTDNFDNALCYSAIKWEQSVLAAKAAQSFLGERYYEIRYENLVNNTSQELVALSKFIGTPGLNYKANTHSTGIDKQLRTTEKQTNSAFGDMTSGISNHAVNRWKESLSDAQINAVEATVNSTLKKLGYLDKLHSPDAIQVFWNACRYRGVVNIKHFIKDTVWPGRLTTSPLELDQD